MITTQQTKYNSQFFDLTYVNGDPLALFLDDSTVSSTNDVCADTLLMLLTVGNSIYLGYDALYICTCLGKFLRSFFPLVYENRLGPENGGIKIPLKMSNYLTVCMA